MIRLLLLCTLIHGAIPQGTKTRCSAPPVYKGEDASVTCFFSEDVSQTNRNFKIYHLGPDGGTAQERAVLDCYWPDRTKVSCDTVAPGYKFNHAVSDYLTLTIPQATEDSVGTYECQVEPADPDNITPCTFTLKYGVKPVYTTTSEAQPFTTTTAPVTSAGTVAADDSSNSAGIVVAVIFTLLIVAAVVLLFIFRKRARKAWTNFFGRARTQRLRTDAPRKDEETPEPDQPLISVDGQSQSKPNQSKSAPANYNDEEEEAVRKPLLFNSEDETTQYKTNPNPHNEPAYYNDKRDKTFTTPVQTVDTNQQTPLVDSVEASGLGQSHHAPTNYNDSHHETPSHLLLAVEAETTSDNRTDSTDTDVRARTCNAIFTTRGETPDVPGSTHPETTTKLTEDEESDTKRSQPGHTPNHEMVPRQIKHEVVDANQAHPRGYSMDETQQHTKVSEFTTKPTEDKKLHKDGFQSGQASSSEMAQHQTEREVAGANLGLPSGYSGDPALDETPALPETTTADHKEPATASNEPEVVDQTSLGRYSMDEAFDESPLHAGVPRAYPELTTQPKEDKKLDKDGFETGQASSGEMAQHQTEREVVGANLALPSGHSGDPALDKTPALPETTTEDHKEPTTASNEPEVVDTKQISSEGYSVEEAHDESPQYIGVPPAFPELTTKPTKVKEIDKDEFKTGQTSSGGMAQHQPQREVAGANLTFQSGYSGDPVPDEKPLQTEGPRALPETTTADHKEPATARNEPAVVDASQTSSGGFSVDEAHDESPQYTGVPRAYPELTTKPIEDKELDKDGIQTGQTSSGEMAPDQTKHEEADKAVGYSGDPALDETPVQTEGPPALHETTTADHEEPATASNEPDQTSGPEMAPKQTENEQVEEDVDASMEHSSDELQANAESTGLPEQENKIIDEQDFEILLEDLGTDSGADTEDKLTEGLEDENGPPSKPHAPGSKSSQGSIETDENETGDVSSTQKSNAMETVARDNASQQGSESLEAEEGKQHTVTSDLASSEQKAQDTDHNVRGSLLEPTDDTVDV